MSYTSLTYHIVLSTYRRQPAINIPNENLLYRIIYHMCTQRGCHVHRIGGMPDHVHILCDIPPTIAVAQLIKVLKSETSKFLTDSDAFPVWVGWSQGYGIFTIDASTTQTRINYIANQKEHHKKETFHDEFLRFLRDHNVDPTWWSHEK